MAVVKFLSFAVLLVLGIYVLMCAFLYFTQSRFVYFPLKEMTAIPTDVGLDYKVIEYEAADGVRIHAWFVPARQSRAIVLFCHGNAGNISHRLDTLKIFNSLGLSTFIFDYRGYGRSGGQPSEKGTYLDAEGAWDYLAKKMGVKPKEILLAGRSLGGAVASWLAVKKKPRALIIESSFTSIPELGGQFYPFLPVRLLTRFNYNTREYINSVKCPVLVIHSPDDEIIPFSHGQEIFAAAHQPKNFLQLRGSHNEGFKLFRERYIQGLKEFIFPIF